MQATLLVRQNQLLTSRNQPNVDNDEQQLVLVKSVPEKNATF